MARDAETEARLERIRSLNKLPPRMLIGSACAEDPEAADFASDIGKRVFDFMVERNRGTSMMVIVMGALGYGLGKVIDTKMAGAGEALDHAAEFMTAAFKFGLESGFAEARSDENARAGNNGATGG